MNDESRLLALVWETVSDFVSNSEKQEAANRLVHAFVEAGNEIDLLFDAEGECHILDRALTACQDKADEEEDYLDEEHL